MSLVYVPNEITVQNERESVGEGESEGRRDVLAEDKKDEECGGVGRVARRRGQRRAVCKGLKKHCSNAMTATTTAAVMFSKRNTRFTTGSSDTCLMFKEQF